MCLLCKLILNLIIGFILIFIYTPYVWKWSWNIKDKDTRGRRNWLYLIHRRGACVQWYCMGVLLIHCLYNYDIMLVVMVHTNVRGLIIFSLCGCAQDFVIVNDLVHVSEKSLELFICFEIFSICENILILQRTMIVIHKLRSKHWKCLISNIFKGAHISYTP